MANLMRAEMLDELEACSPELKRMLAPIMLLGDSGISLGMGEKGCGNVREVEIDRWGMEGHYFILVRFFNGKSDLRGKVNVEGWRACSESMPGPSSWKGHATLWAVPGLA